MQFDTIIFRAKLKSFYYLSPPLFTAMLQPTKMTGQKQIQMRLNLY